MGEVILRRVMSDSRGDISIEIDKPTREGELECACSYRILRNGVPEVASAAHGLDEVQAAMLAFDAIREDLKEKFADANWQGLPIDLAFPRAIPYMAGLDTYRELELSIDKRLEEKFG